MVHGDIFELLGEVGASVAQLLIDHIFLGVMDCVGVDGHVTHDLLKQLEVGVLPRRGLFDEVIEQLQVLYGMDACKTVVIDTMDALERIIWNKVCVDQSVKNIEDIGYGKGYMFAMTYWTQLQQMLDACRGRGMAICLLCHTEIKPFNSPIVDSYDRYQPNLHKKASALFTGWADIIGFANWKTMVRTEDVGFNKRINKGVGTGERVLNLVERPAWVAKNRYGMPDEIEFSWAALNEHLV